MDELVERWKQLLFPIVFDFFNFSTEKLKNFLLLHALPFIGHFWSQLSFLMFVHKFIICFQQTVSLSIALHSIKF